MLTLKQLERHIKKCKRKGIRYNFLELAENITLSNDVARLFTFESPGGYCGYDWLNGNDKLQDLIKRTV